MYYLVNKAGLPKEIKDSLVRGDTVEYSKYIRLQDVYGVTEELKDYYIDNVSGTSYGNVDVKDVNPNLPLIKSNQNENVKNTLKETLENKYGVKVDEELGITAGNITVLKELELDGESLNDLKDIEFIAELNVLQSLTLKNFTLEDLDGIEGCSFLNYIYLSNCVIKNYSKLSQVLGLTNLYLYFSDAITESVANEQVTNLGDGLKTAYNLNSLEYFGISGDFIFDGGGYTYEFALGNQEKSVNYYNLSVFVPQQKSNLTDISGLKNFPVNIKEKIKYMYLNNNNLKSIEPLAGFVNLYELRLMGNSNLESLTGLENHNELKYLVLQNSGIARKSDSVSQNLGVQDISGLLGCKNLYYLSLLGNKNLKNLDGLTKCSSLYFLLCDNCDLTDISSLAGIENKRFDFFRIYLFFE